MAASREQLAFPGVDNGSTREVILRILARRAPLSLRAVQGLLRQQHRLALSIQGVHKALRALQQQGAVAHQRDGYFLIIDWLYSQKEKLDTTIELVEVSSGSQPHLAALEQEARTVQCFSSLQAAEPHWIRTILQLADREAAVGAKRMLLIGDFPYWLFLNLGGSLALLNKLQSSGYRVQQFFFDSSRFTRWSITFYRTLGAQVRALRTTQLEPGNYYNIINDSVIHASLNPRLVQGLKRMVSKYHMLTEVPASLARQLFSQRAGVRIEVEHNPGMAELLRNLVST